ncbi:major facilitator superfamily protein [Pandoraea aquatica]|uniref:Major facilitator superfamily protein n=1 Tax=Pandoraea aquatica TaxID=2508290 RepID=A0A5E4WMX0_9BURK|nr:MFS transporter [Pandoraea aquatica]VVE24346.1 major facilitator superfamily protein [Pandoraea aquatica]
MSDARPPLSPCSPSTTVEATSSSPHDTASPDAGVVSLVTSLSRANLAAQFSEQMTLAVIPIVAVIALRASAEQTASLQAATTLPFLLLSLPAGVLADRYRRKPLMIATELLRAVALLLLFALFQMKWLSLTALGVLGFAMASGTVVFGAAAPSLVAMLVGPAHLLTANRRLETARSIAFTAGPAIGGVLAGVASGTFAFAAAFALSLGSAFWLSRLPAEALRAPTRRDFKRELAEGVRFIATNTYLRSIVATAFVFNTSWYLLLAIFAFYAIDALAFSAQAVGAALGVYGFGMVCGAMGYARIAQGLTFGRQILLGPVCAALAAVLMASTSMLLDGARHSAAYALVFVAFFLFGFGPIVWTISTTSLRQVVTPGGLIARVSAATMTATFGARPLGAFLGAWIASSLGIRACLIAMAAGFALQFAIIVRSPAARMKSLTAPVKVDS